MAASIESQAQLQEARDFQEEAEEQVAHWTSYDFAESGYDYICEPNENLICPICRNPFVNPVMCDSTDHVFCRLCLLRSLERSPTCPIDRLPLTISPLNPAPRIVLRLVDELLVRCPFKQTFACDLVTQRYLIKTHTDSHACEIAFRNGLVKEKPLEPLAPRSNKVSDEFRFEWFNGRARRIESCAQSDFFNVVHCPSSPPDRVLGSEEETACRFEKFGCRFHGSLASLHYTHLASDAAGQEEGTRCFFAPIAEILDIFLSLETENGSLRRKLAEARTVECDDDDDDNQYWNKVLPTALEGLSESRLELESLRKSPQKGEARLLTCPSLSSTNPSSQHGSVELDSHLSSSPDVVELLWIRISSLEDELTRAQESSWVLRELVRTLTRHISLLCRKQQPPPRPPPQPSQRESSSSSLSLGNKGQIKL